MGKAPGLYRLARALRRAAIVAVVLIVVYVALAGYSLTKFRPSDVHTSSISSPQLVGQLVTIGGELNLTNPGFLPVNSLEIAGTVAFPNGTVAARTPPVSVAIPAGATATLPLSVSVPLSASGPVESLLTVDQQLLLRFFLNVSYATLFTAELSANSSHSWGAPFSGLNVTPGTPIAGSSTNVSVPVTIAFADHAPWGDAGTVSIALTRTGGGCPPSSTSIPVNVPPQGTFNRTIVVNTTSSCLTPGQRVAFTYSTPDLTLSFPPVRIA